MVKSVENNKVEPGNYRVGDNTRLEPKQQFYNVLMIKYNYSLIVCCRFYIIYIM